MLIFRPRPDRQAEPFMVHMLEACVFQPPFDLGSGLRVLAEVDAGPAPEIVPFPLRVLGREGAVFCVYTEVVVLELGVAAGRRGVEALGDQSLPVGDGGGEVAAVDEVEGVLEGPGFLGVVDFELDVGWDPGWGVFFELVGYFRRVYVDVFGVLTYHVGCVGLRSVPRMSESGKASPISMAQMPVPVPMSRIREGLAMGAR